MSRSEYISAMSGIQPSEQTIERIMDMTNKRKITGFRKGLIGVLVVLAILACGGLTANAATDGAVARAIDTGIKHIKVIIDGRELDESEYATVEREYVNDEGETVKEYEVALPDGAGVKYEIVADEDGVEWNKESSGEEVIIQTEDFNEPTTAVN